MTTPRQPTRQPNMRPVAPKPSTKRGGGYDGPHVIKDRDDIHKVSAYDPGIKGKQQKLRPRWPY